MSDQPDAYQSYLVRLWRVQCTARWQWRVSIESPHTGERQCFASLEQLFAFLGERCRGQVLDAPETRRSADTELGRHREEAVSEPCQKNRERKRSKL